MMPFRSVVSALISSAIAQGGKMRKVLCFGVVAYACLTFGTLSAAPAAAQCELVSGKEFDGAIVPNFYLEGNAIPVQKRNAVMVKCTGAQRMIFALLDTSGYSIDVQQKYLGMATIERKVSLGAATLAPGAYGLGLQKPAAADQPAKLIIYDVGGQKVGETAAPVDAKLAQPTPLQVVVAKDQPVRLYLGRYSVEVR
jgi:hypothetical protein